MHGGPALRGGLVAVLVFLRGVEDGDADVTVGVDCMIVTVKLVLCDCLVYWKRTQGKLGRYKVRRTVRMVQRRLKLHLRRHVRVIRRKRKTSTEETTYYSF